MSGLRTVLVENDAVRADSDQPFPSELFEDFSKEELLTLLLLMHRILGVKGRKDIDVILTNLPQLLRESLALPKHTHGKVVPGLAGRHSRTDHEAYRVADYLLSCLVSVQARMETRPAKHAAKHQLSSRELTVLGWMKEGKTNWEIAKILELSERTVRFHVGTIFKKLDVTSRTQAVARALGAGLIVA